MPVDKIASSVAAGAYANTAKAGQGAGIGAGDKASLVILSKKQPPIRLIR